MATNKSIKLKNDLGYLGEDFQVELVKCFIEDQMFFKDIESIVDQNMFTEDNLRRIVGFMKDRYSLAGVVASYKDLDTLVRSKISDTISIERCLAMLKKIQTTETRGIDLIEGYSEKFFKQQNLTKAINKAYDIIKLGDSERYNDIEDIVRKALETNNRRDLGFRVFDNMEEALKEDYRCTIPTGADMLDDAFYGGLGKGELGIIIAPSSVGKTSATTGFAANAAVTKTEDNNYQGYKVLHIFFEDEEVNIKRKYYAFLTDTDACMLSQPDIRPRIIEQINQHEWKDMIQRNVVGYHAQNGEFSASDIKRFIQQHIAMGFKPDMVVVDYFECLKLEKPETSADSEWTREGLTMRKLESIAHEFNVALWVPVQGTKDSFNQQIVGLTQAGGSVKKVQIGHVIISFARTEEMRLRDQINIFINKFRPGRIKVNAFMGVTFNNGTTKFDFSTCTDVDNVLDNNQQYYTDVARDTKNTYKNK
jgi:replicative DNA helicase